MMNERGKSDPAEVACEADEQGGAIRRGAGGAKGWDHGEYEPAAHGPDAEPGNQCHRCWPHTSNRKGREEGTVHCAFPPYQRRTAPEWFLRHQAGAAPGVDDTQCSETPQCLEAGTAEFKFQPERELPGALAAAMAAYVLCLSARIEGGRNAAAAAGVGSLA
jgi:hypothetical protein